MINKTLTVCLLLISTMVCAVKGLKVDNIEVKVTNIDHKSQTIEYVQNNKAKIMKLHQDVINNGYFDNEGNAIILKKLKLNKKYFLRTIHDEYIDGDKKQVSQSHVSAISTKFYDDLF